MFDIAQLSQETLTQLMKSVQSQGFFSSSGIQGYDLSGLVSDVPVNVPARNNTSAFPRTTAPEGNQVAVWRALLNVNANQSDAAVGADYAGTMTDFEEVDQFAAYRILSKASRVTLDQIAVAKGFADALAVSEIQTLNQLFISQDMHIINSQNWALSAPATPTLTTATTGGSIAASTTVYVKVAARSGANYFVGYASIDGVAATQSGNSVASTGADFTVGSTTSTNTVTASVPAVKGAVAYDWYVGTSASQFYYTTTTVAAVTITAVPTSAQAIPTNLPLLSQLAPPSTPPTADTSAAPSNWYNGVIASSLGDFGPAGPVTPGTGTPSGATFIDFGGNAPSLSGGGIDVLDQLNDKIWASVQMSPTAYMVNSAQGDEISKEILSDPSATTFLPPTDADARTNLAGGGFIGRYVNRAAAGVPVPIEVHPRVAPGTIVARTDRVPFPGSNIGSVFEVRTLFDTMRFNYASALQNGTLGGGPRFDYEIRSYETLVNRAPLAQAVASNIA
jgi:hypothetical protein